MNLTKSEAQATRLARWICSGDTGLSSKTIVGTMFGVPVRVPHHPIDRWDLGRCYRLLCLFQEWEPRLDELVAADRRWERWIKDLRAALTAGVDPGPRP